MSNNSVEVQQDVSPLVVMENMNISKVQQSIDLINQFQVLIQSTLKQGVDYGDSYPGSGKPSLLKPGAEKILTVLGLASTYEIIERIQDFEEGFFAYTLRCTLTKLGQVVTEGVGHCNSKEKKYLSEKQDIFMLGNTCLKMAKKRAQVDAALTVGSLSNLFTQDLEDMAQFQKNERIETMTIEDAEKMKITFGKHNGKTLGQINKDYPDYILWLKDNAKEAIVRSASELLMKSKKADAAKGQNTQGNNYAGTPFEEEFKDVQPGEDSRIYERTK